MAPPMSTLMAPSVVDLEASLELLLEFDECVVDLPQYVPGGTLVRRKRRRLLPSMMLTVLSSTCGLFSLRGMLQA